MWVGEDIGLMYLKLKRASGTNVAKVCIIIAVSRDVKDEGLVI